MANQNTLLDTHQEVGQFTNKSKLGIVFLVSKNDIIILLDSNARFIFQGNYIYFDLKWNINIFLG